MNKILKEACDDRKLSLPLRGGGAFFVLQERKMIGEA